MNPEDLEQKIKVTPVRPLPSSWRAEILAQASRQAAPAKIASRSWIASLNERLNALLWPCPQAWAALAAVWVLLLGINYATKPPSPVLAKQMEAPSEEIIMAGRAQERMLAQLLELYDPPAAAPRNKFVPRPSSACRPVIIAV